MAELILVEKWILKHRGNSPYSLSFNGPPTFVEIEIYLLFEIPRFWITTQGIGLILYCSRLRFFSL